MPQVWTRGDIRPQRMGSEVRRAQLIAAGLDIAIETGFIAVTCYAVAHRADCHHNLVRKYLGRRKELCEAVAAHARQLGVQSVILEAQRLGFLK